MQIRGRLGDFKTPGLNRELKRSKWRLGLLRDRSTNVRYPPPGWQQCQCANLFISPQSARADRLKAAPVATDMFSEQKRWLRFSTNPAREQRMQPEPG